MGKLQLKPYWPTANFIVNDVAGNHVHMVAWEGNEIKRAIPRIGESIRFGTDTYVVRNVLYENDSIGPRVELTVELAASVRD